MKILILLISILCISATTPKIFVRNYYKSGVEKSCGWVQSDAKVGFWKFFYETGQLKSEGHYSKNLKNGYWTTYTTSGFKKAQGSYNKGKKTGYWYYYDTSENIAKEGHYSDGIPEKWWKYYVDDRLEKCIYDADGKTRYCLIYINNKLCKGNKYINDVLIQEWNSVSHFKRDNPDFSF